MPQFPPEVYALIDAAIAEDQTFNDPTTAAVIKHRMLALW